MDDSSTISHFIQIDGIFWTVGALFTLKKLNFYLMLAFGSAFAKKLTKRANRGFLGEFGMIAKTVGALMTRAPTNTR